MVNVKWDQYWRQKKLVHFPTCTRNSYCVWLKGLGTVEDVGLWHNGWRRVMAQWMAESYGTVDSAELWRMGAGMQRC